MYGKIGYTYLETLTKKGKFYIKIYIYIYIYVCMYVYIEKMHKDMEEGETNQLYICIIVKPLLHLIL